jgi:hypothetical protein
MTLVPGIITLIMNYPPSPYTLGRYKILTCLGRPEVLYDFDYFMEGSGGANLQGPRVCLEWSGLSWLVCVGTLSILVAISSNLAEIYFLGHILVSIKRQTNGVAPLLTQQSLELRQRYKLY